jgi:hypothetical protein
VADCIVCMTPMIVWRIHGLPDPQLEQALLGRLEQVATERYGDGGFWVDPERRRIPDHWHAHARPAGGFFDPRSTFFESWGEGEAQVGGGGGGGGEGGGGGGEGSSADAGSPPSPGKVNE